MEEGEEVQQPLAAAVAAAEVVAEDLAAAVTSY